MKRLLVLACACALVAPALAWAHASLRAESPGFQQELQVSPKAVTLGFDQFVSFPYIRVYNAQGRSFGGKAVARGRSVVAPMPKLPTGAYTVRWHALSSDGHVVSGVWTFGVRMKAPPPMDAFGAGGPTSTEHVVRWLYFLSFAVLIGSLGFRLICLREPVPPRVSKRLYVLSGVGVVGAVEVGILGFCLRTEDVLQLPFGKYIYGDLTPIAQGTRFGQAFVIMTLGFALVAAFIFLSWLLERRDLLAVAFVLSLALVSGLSLSGHDAVDAGSSKATELADWVHLSAASLWLGGLLSLAIAVWPADRGLGRESFYRFSRVAVVLVGLVLVAGTYLAIVRVPHLRDLWTQRYGVVLSIKVSLVAAAVAWGAVHHFFVRPKLRDAGEGTLGRVGRSLAGESLVGVAVLLAAAVLVDSKPPPRPAPAAVTQAAAQHR